MKRTIITIILTFAMTAFALHAIEQKAFTGAGIIESSTGGFMFPDGSVQQTAATSPPGCTVIEAVPIVISDPGIYCFNNSLVADIATGAAIEITSNWVTIDLNGWSLVGTDYLDTIGIRAQNQQEVTIRNGTIEGFGTGIHLIADSSFPTKHLVENTHILRFYQTGIWVEGWHNTVRRNRVVGYHAGLSTEPYGIRMEGVSGRIVDNDILNVRGKEFTYGLYLLGADNMVIEGNRIDTVYSSLEDGTAIFVSGSYGVLIRGTSITSATRGIYFVSSSGKYMDTLTSGVTTPFTGGTAVGTNS